MKVLLAAAAAPGFDKYPLSSSLACCFQSCRQQENRYSPLNPSKDRRGPQRRPGPGQGIVFLLLIQSLDIVYSVNISLLQVLNVNS